MREYIATVTSKGQVTLPVEVRRRMGIDPGDQVAIVLGDDAGRAEFRRVSETVRSVRGFDPDPAPPRWSGDGGLRRPDRGGDGGPRRRVRPPNEGRDQVIFIDARTVLDSMSNVCSER